jgi:hypothetical protein
MCTCCALPTWWLWRGGCTRSHSEHGRETPQRRWYFVSRRGRVGRCQVCKAQHQVEIFSHYENWNTPRVAHRGPPFALLIQQGLGAAPAGTSPAPRIGKHIGSSSLTAGWSSPVARQAHNLKVAGSNPAPATTETCKSFHSRRLPSSSSAHSARNLSRLASVSRTPLSIRLWNSYS